MGGTPGIAGSPRPELEGIFLTRDLFEAEFFCRMAADRLPDGIDVWEVRLDLDGEDAWGAGRDERFAQQHGYLYFKGAIEPSRLRLVDDSARAAAATARDEHPEGAQIEGGFTITTRKLDGGSNP